MNNIKETSPPVYGLRDLFFYHHYSFIWDTPYKIKAGTMSCSIDDFCQKISPCDKIFWLLPIRSKLSFLTE